MKKLSLALFLMLLANTSLGFGAKVHRVIAEIAESHLTTSSKAAIAVLLKDESLADVSTWADEMRYSNQGSSFWSYDYSSNWHFINVDKSNNYIQSSKNSRADAYLALSTFITILKKEKVENSIILEGLAKAQREGSNHGFTDEQISLRFLIHLVADIHQPLHLGYEEDRGGNNIEVTWFSKKTNLHSVWDSRLIAAQDLSIRRHVQKVEKQIDSLTPNQLRSIQSDDPIIWIQEGLTLRESVYDIQRFNGELSETYLEEFSPLVEQQMLKAGLRLATLLNSIFSP